MTGVQVGGTAASVGVATIKRVDVAVGCIGVGGTAVGIGVLIGIKVGVGKTNTVGGNRVGGEVKLGWTDSAGHVGGITVNVAVGRIGVGVLVAVGIGVDVGGINVGVVVGSGVREGVSVAVTTGSKIGCDAVGSATWLAESELFIALSMPESGTA